MNKDLNLFNIKPEDLQDLGRGHTFSTMLYEYSLLKIYHIPHTSHIPKEAICSLLISNC